MRSERIVAATGAAYVVAVLVGNELATGSESDEETGEQVLAHLQAGLGPAASLGLVLEVLSFGALLVFLGYLYRTLRRAERPDGWAAGAAFGAGLVATAIKLASAAPAVAATLRADELTPDLARTLDDLNGASFVVSGWGYGIFVALAAWAAFESRAVPRWLSTSGLVAGVLTVAAGTAGVLDPAGYVPIPFLLTLAWVLVVSVLWTVRPPSVTPRAARQSVPAAA